MPPKPWMKNKYVADELEKKNKEKRSTIHETLLIPKLKKATAWVVSIDWLRQELDKCEANGRETIRLAVDKNDELWIEGFANVDEIEGCPPGPYEDPPGWNNDWPEVDLP